MSTDDALAALWHYIDAGRGPETVSQLVKSWLHERIERHEPVNSDLLYAITDRRLDWSGGEHGTPKALHSFIAKLASMQSVQSVLDPTCGLGLLLHDVAVSSGAQVVHGIDINTECCEVAQAVCGSNAKIVLGDALSAPTLQPKYDLIVATPPFGLKVRGTPSLPHLGVRFGGEMGHALTLWACARLRDGGTAMIVLTPAFLWSQHGLEVQEAIRKSASRVRALIHLPGGTFTHTPISTYLAVFERGEQEDVFIGEFADSPEHQKHLISNYRRRKPGDQPALGRLSALSAFRGFDAFVAQERLKRLARAAGWSDLSADSVILKSVRLSSIIDSAEQDANGVYLRLAGHPAAMADPASLPRSAVRDLVYLSIDSKVADARYLVHWFNQSQVGQATLASVRRGGVVGRLDLTALLKVNLYLPSLDEQRDFLRGIEHLNQVRAEALELESALWSCTEKADVVVQKILTINQEDRYEDWIETLPFPLASILWRHRAGEGSTREQYEVLLHFFEATAAFVATIHLSAFMADDALWSDAAHGLRETLTKQNLSLERATFGAWKLTVEYLSGRCRKLLADEEGMATCTRLYGTANSSHIAMICSPEMLSALQQANNLRNIKLGHGGAIGRMRQRASMTS